VTDVGPFVRQLAEVLVGPGYGDEQAGYEAGEERVGDEAGNGSADGHDVGSDE
jgi:hypothetical protein